MLNAHKSVSSALAATIVASTSLFTATSAQAHDRHFRHHHQPQVIHCDHRPDLCNRHRHRGKNRQDINIGAAILGIVGTAIVVDALTKKQRNQGYTAHTPAPQTHSPYAGNNVYPPAPTRTQTTSNYGGNLQPWTQGWYVWCDRRYRSFNPERGTYRGYDGQDHFCVPK